MRDIEKLLSKVSLPDEVCHKIYEERHGIKCGQCQTAAKVKGSGAINRYNELRTLRCPDLDYVCPYRSGKVIPENHTHILDSE